jgi:hypothetical protein
MIEMFMGVQPMFPPTHICNMMSPNATIYAIVV